MRLIGCCCWVLSLSLGLGAASDREIRDVTVRLIDACEVYDEKAMHSECDRLIAFGEPAFDLAVELLKHDAANVRWQAVKVLGGLGLARGGLEAELLAACGDRDADVRAEAIAVLPELFPDSEPLRSAAKAMCDDEHDLVRSNAWMARWSLDADPLAPAKLVALLGHKDWMVVNAAREHLVAIGEAAVPELIDLASAGNTTAIETLAAIPDLGASEPSIVVILERHADGHDSIISSAAIRALPAMGEPGFVVLDKLCAHQDRRLRTGAYVALSEAPSRSLQQFAAGLEDPEVSVRIAAISGIGRAGACDRIVRDRLVAMLSDSSPDIRGASIAAVGQLGGEHLAAAREALAIVAREDPKSHLRSLARGLIELQ